MVTRHDQETGHASLREWLHDRYKLSRDVQDCLPAIENQEDWDREIAQCLERLATLAGGLDLVPSTYMVVYNHSRSSSMRSITFFFPLGLQAYTCHT